MKFLIFKNNPKPSNKGELKNENMLGNDAMEFLKTLHHLDEIWKHHDDAEYNDRQLTQFAERYHEHKLKLLGIADVVGQNEQLSKRPNTSSTWECFTKSEKQPKGNV